MAHLQSALRAYALEALRPAVVLERMNSFVLEGEQGGMVTLLYAIVDPDGQTLQVASAGHPPPLVLDPDGGPTFVEAPAGSPLGVTRYAAYEESTTTLDPWSTVLLYTDGLVEGPDLPLGQGLDGLRSSLDGGPREPEALCHAVLDTLDVRAGFRDDLALLALQLTPPGKTLALALPARPGSLAPMRRAVAQWLRLSGADEDEVYEMLVACGEACANSVAHAHPALSDSSFEVRAGREGAEIDHGSRHRAVATAGRARGDEGEGFAVMRELMDDVDIEPSDRHDRQAAAPAARTVRHERPSGRAQLRDRRQRGDRAGRRGRSRASTPRSWAALAGKLPSDRAGLIIDLSRVTYLDSAGIEFLFDLARRLRTHRQRLRLVVPTDAPMRRVLELCDMEPAAPIDATVEGALEGLGEQSPSPRG
jgi:anti-anti-sigma factor